MPDKCQGCKSKIYTHQFGVTSGKKPIDYCIFWPVSNYQDDDWGRWLQRGQLVAGNCWTAKSEGGTG